MRFSKARKLIAELYMRTEGSAREASFCWKALSMLPGACRGLIHSREWGIPSSHLCTEGGPRQASFG